jgi:L-fuculose-phosphate aldolase
MMGIIGGNEVLARELARYSRLCYDRGLATGSGGNLSARIPGTDLVLVTASGVALRDVEPGNIVAVNLAGDVRDGPASLKPSKEIGFHLEVFRARPKVNAVVHVHPAHASVYATRGNTIPLETISAKLKLKQGSIVPDAPPGSQELRDAVARAAAEADPDVTVLLMARHGLVSFGASLCAAFDDAELAAETARVALLLETGAGSFPRIEGGTALIELSVPLADSTVHYPSDPPFRKTAHADFTSAGVYVSKLEMGAHIGTHVDAPLHVLEGAPSISALPLHRFFGSAIVVDARKEPGEDIEPSDFETAEVRENDIVIFRTGWEERSGSSRFFQGEWPGVSAEAAEGILARRVKAIGLDSPSVDSPKAIAAGFGSHKLLLSAGVPVFEALVNLSRLVGRRFFFIGLPLGIEHGDASPVRAVALLGQAYGII